MAKNQFHIKINDRELKNNLRTFNDKTNKRVGAVVDRHSVIMQNEARANAPWMDQTGNARQGLYAHAFHEENRHRIVLFHSMPYGKWLEIRWSGKYAIILPTILKTQQNLINTLKQVLR